jgi:hypothetical protein
VVTFDYGMKEKNPIDHVRFYVKDQPHKPVQVRKDQVCVKVINNTLGIYGNGPNMQTCICMCVGVSDVAREVHGTEHQSLL